MSASRVKLKQGHITGGFAHAQVFALADKVVEAVKTGKIRKFFVMAGCDGRMKSREYYTDFAAALARRYGNSHSRLCQSTGIINLPWEILTEFQGFWMPDNAMIPIHWQ